MPIYAYKCASCGHTDDVLQKIADAPLTVCPKCGKETYSKQVTAPQFQLKGSGWYVTDFRGGTSPAAGKSEDAAKATGDKPADAKPAASTESSASTAKPAESKPAAPAAKTSE